MSRLVGKIAIVTGGDSGIGKGIALAFAREGCDVAINFHSNKEKADETAAEIKKIGRKTLVSQGDVGKEDYIKGLVDQTVKEFGHLDIIVNNAGVGGEKKPVHELSFEDWHKVLSTNLDGVFLGSKYGAIQLLKQGKGGSIINISSVHEEGCGENTSAYSASKAAVRNLMRSQSVELAPKGIRVNNICPGMILTPMNQSALDDEKERKEREAKIPLKRAGVPADIGNMAVFLASEEASYCTGNSYFVDGGWMVTRPDV